MGDARRSGLVTPDASASLRVHGDPDRDELARLGIEPSTLLDFSVNVSPFGAHPAVLRAAREAPLDRYPDSTGKAARTALGEALGRDANEIVLGNGAAELLWGIVRRFASRARALVVGPTFSEPWAAAEAHGSDVIAYRADEADDFRFDVADVDAAIAAARPTLAYLCHPNNPTGTSLGAREIAELARRHEGTIFLVDQAFLSLSARHAEASEPFPANTIVVRSMTKDHALPGLRVAYALATHDLAHALEAARPPWMTSAPAQAAIVEAVRHPEHVVAAREALLVHRAGLASALATLGLHVVPSDTIFLLARVSDADALRASLLARHGILVRSGCSFGLPHHVRLCARPAEDVERLVTALRAELAA